MKPRSRAVRLVGVLAIVSTSVLATSAAGGAATADPVIQTLPYTAIKGPWLVWNKKTCRFVTTNNHPATYTARMRKQSAGNPMRMIFSPEATTFSVDALINGGVKAAAERAGVEYTQLSNDYPSTSRPLQVVDQAVALKTDVAVSGNVYANLYPEIQAKYEKACIPMVDMFNFPLPHPAPGFQSGYASEGASMAKATIPIVKSRKWPMDQVWILLCGSPAVGTGANTLYDVIRTFRSQVAKELNIPSSRWSPILNCQATPGPAGARTATTDWLTAHPQVKYVIASMWADSLTVGMVQALEAKGFSSKNAVAASGDAADNVLKTMSPTSIIQVDADKAFINWGVFSVSIAQDVYAGRPVPSYMDPGTTAITPANVKQTLKTRAAFLKKYGGG